MIKAILFDMNGIIIDDEYVHELAFKETVPSFGINLTHQDYLGCCEGRTDRAGYELIADHFKIELPIEQLLHEKSKRYLKLFPANKKSYPGVLELIQNLSEKYLIALTSSSSRAEVDLITREFKIDSKFKVTISADEVTKGKPDPEPYLITCQKLNIKPSEAVVIEDSKSGVNSAKAAGCYCIGVTTTHSRIDLQAASLVVDQFSEITEKLISSLEI